MTTTTPTRRPRPTAAGVALLLVALLLAPGVALAHGGLVPQPEVTRVPEGVDGLVVRGIVTVGPQLLVRNPSSTPLVVLSDDGVPFLRISGDGVDADLSARAWWEANDPTTRGQDPPGDAPTGWTRVSADDAFGWFDVRLLRAAVAGQDHTWSIDVLVDGRPDRIEGRSVETQLDGAWSTTLDGDGTFGGARLTVVSGPVPAMVVQRRDAGDVVVVGTGGEPMLRLTEDLVEANLASPSWHAHAQLDSGTPEPDAPADAAAEPVWEQVSAGPTVAWLEPRAASLAAVPRDGDELTRPWEVPLLVDGEDFVAAGSTVWTGDRPAGPLDALGEPTTLGVVALGAGLAWLGLRRREARRGAATD